MYEKQFSPAALQVDVDGGNGTTEIVLNRRFPVYPIKVSEMISEAPAWYASDRLKGAVPE